MEAIQEYELLLSKLADIRELFDESDMKAEGHGMEDAIACPYAVACYAENKLKRLLTQIKEQENEIQWLYGKLNQISDLIERSRSEVRLISSEKENFNSTVGFNFFE